MTVDFASFLDRDMVMCFFGGGIGHSHLPVDQRHAKLEATSNRESESDSDPEAERREEESGPDEFDESVESSDNEQDAGQESDTCSSEPGERSDSELESDNDGYDSL
jgi:hypothetical protein